MTRVRGQSYQPEVPKFQGDYRVYTVKSLVIERLSPELEEQYRKQLASRKYRSGRPKFESVEAVAKNTGPILIPPAGIKRLEMVYEMCGGFCHLCGHPVPYPDTEKKKGSGMGATVDHIVPRSRGGTNCLTNLKLAHAFCNSLRGTSKITIEVIQYVVSEYEARYYYKKHKRWFDKSEKYWNLFRHGRP